MAQSIVYILSLGLLVLLVTIYPKAKNKEAFILELCTAIIFVMCYAVFAAQLFSAIGIRVNLKSISIAYNLLSIVLLVQIKRKKNIQNLYLDRFQIVSIIFLTILFAVVELKTFSYELRASFCNIHDAGGHFTMAMDVVRQQTVGKMPFAPLHNAMIIEICSPFLNEIKYYKAFILADSLHYYFELIFFYSLTLRFQRKKITKYIAPIIAILYWWGYPLYSYIVGNFVYWGWGVILCVYVILEMDYLFKEGKNYVRYLNIFMGFIGVLSCYILFGPPLFLGSILLIYPRVKDKVLKNRKYLLLMLGIGLVMILGVTFSLYIYFGNDIKRIFEAVNQDGWIYSNIGSDFLITLPFVICLLLFSKEKRCMSIPMHFLLSFIIYTAIMFILVLGNIMSRYYYYKYYYLIWFVWWIVVLEAIDQIEVYNETKKYVKAYLITIIISYLFCFTRIEKIIPEQMKEDSEGVFGTDLYQYNFGYLDQDYEQYKYTTGYMDINEYVRNLDDSRGAVLFLNYNDCKSEAIWFHAITEEPYTGVLDDYSQQQLNSIISDEQYDYFVVMKDSGLYTLNQDFFRQYLWIYENEEGFVMKK